MDAAGSERATLLGISEGAAMAALFAALHPQRVEAIVLYGGFARATPTDGYPWGFEPEVWEPLFEGLDETWGEGTSLLVLAPSRFEDEPFRRWFSRFEPMTGRHVEGVGYPALGPVGLLRSPLGLPCGGA